MSITAIVEALIEAGATNQMILAAVRAEESARGQELESKREKDRLRKQVARANQQVNLADSSLSAESTDSADSSSLPPIPLTSFFKEKPPKGGKKKVSPPEWIPSTDWGDYAAWRKTLRGGFTARMQELVIEDLEKLWLGGHDPGKLLKRALKGGWKSIHPAQDGSTKAQVISAKRPNVMDKIDESKLETG